MTQQPPYQSLKGSTNLGISERNFWPHQIFILQYFSSTSIIWGSRIFNMTMSEFVLQSIVLQHIVNILRVAIYAAGHFQGQKFFLTGLRLVVFWYLDSNSFNFRTFTSCSICMPGVPDRVRMTSTKTYCRPDIIPIACTKQLFELDICICNLSKVASRKGLLVKLIGGWACFLRSCANFQSLLQ